YLCLARLEQAESSEATLFDSETRDEVAQLAGWASKTKDGSLADLPTQPRSEVWDEVAAEPDLCQRFQCKHFEKCFVFRARLSAARDLLSVASVDLVEERLASAVRGARDKSTMLFDLLDTLLDESGAQVLRLTDAFATHRIWESGLRLALQDTWGEISVLRE